VSEGGFAAVVAVGAVPAGWFLVPAVAAWAPRTPTPLLERSWRVGQCLATVLAAAAIALAIGDGWRVVPLLLLVPVVVAASAADLITRRLPDRLVLPSVPATAALMAVAALAAGHPGWLGGAAAGAAGLAGFLFVMHLISPGGMGFGDVKFGLILGAMLGWLHPLLAVYGLLAASLLGSLVGGAIALARRDRKLAIPFGPFLAAGTVIALVVGAAMDVGT
jgi:leader peptidase (prepilin peptidase) / N-methyltransferase